MKIKLNRSMVLNGVRVPKGTILSFGNENYAVYRGKRITKKMVGIEEEKPDFDPVPDGCTEDADAVATSVIEMLRTKYPDGFTSQQLSEDLGDNIEGAIYSINDSEDENNDAVLTLEIEDNVELKIYLAKDDEGVFTVTGEYDATEVPEVNAATEAFLGRMVLATKRKNHSARRRK